MLAVSDRVRESKRRACGRVMLLRGRRVTADEGHCSFEGSGSLSSGGESESKQSSSSLTAISRASPAIWLGSAGRFRLHQVILPDFVAGLQLLGVNLQCRKQLPILAELVVQSLWAVPGVRERSSCTSCRLPSW